jgi:hypothetical protein
MACSQITTGRSIGECKGIAGISEFYVANADNVTAVGTTGSGATLQINSITAGATGVFYQYPQIQETSSVTFTPTANVQNASLFYETIASMQFSNYDASLRYIVQTLGENNLVIVAKLRSGEYILLGEDGGMDINGGSGQSGQAAGDLNGFTLTFRGIQGTPPKTLDPTFVSSSGWTNLINSTLA